MREPSEREPGDHIGMRADEMPRLIERRAREQYLPAHREAHHARDKVRRGREHIGHAERRDVGHLARMDADTRDERSTRPRHAAHPVLKAQRKPHRRRHARGAGEIAVARVLDERQALLRSELLKERVVQLCRALVRHRAVVGFERGGVADVREKKNGELCAFVGRDRALWLGGHATPHQTPPFRKCRRG